MSSNEPTPGTPGESTIRPPITTTHDTHGGGRPRLIFCLGGSTQSRDEPREFDLRAGITTIGSAPDSHLRLDGIDRRQAEIRRDDDDNYVYVHLGGLARPSRINGALIDVTRLRTSHRIQIGWWTFSYYREEFADHGRPFGGRSGGSEEGSRQRPQSTPRPRGTSIAGGSLPTEFDAGEYF
jgi:hypothetical protein